MIGLVGSLLETSGGGGGGTPGGSNTQVQFNDAGSFGGDSGLTYNKTTDSLTLAGNQTFSGLAKKILGDFSNATRANRLAVQTSTTNGNTRLPFLPNGTSRLSGIDLHDGTDLDNSSFLQVHSDGTNNHCGLNSTKVGTGARKDLVFQIDGITKAKVNEADGKFNVDTLTASGLVGTDASKNLQSVTAATSSVGTDFAIAYSGSTITFALPDAGAAARGLINTGTQTIAGAKTFSDNLTVSKNQNATTSIFASNTTNGNASSVEFKATSDASAGPISFGKFSTGVSTYKIINAKDAFFFNGVGGDFAFINDHAAGGFKFAGGASSTSQFTILSTGSVGVGTTTIGSKFQINGNAAIGYSTSTAAPTNGLDVFGTSLLGKGSANYLQIAGAATTLSPTISALGSDTNINLTLTPKGTGSIIASSAIILKSYTVATLPTGVEGMRAYVTDATAPTYLGTLTGGGAVKCPVFYNGTAWVSA